MKMQRWSWAALAIALGAVGCKSSSGNLSVSASAATPRATTDGGTTSDGGSASLDLGNGILVDRVRIAVLKVKLEGSPAATDGGAAPDGGTDMDAGAPMSLTAGRTSRDHGGGGGDGEGGDDEAEPGEVSVGPFLVDLSAAQLSGGVSQVFDGQIPAGTYREIAIVIGPVSVGDGGTAPAGLAHLGTNSVVVDCTVKGTAFSIAAAIHAKQKREGQVVVDAGGTSKNVTLSVDPTGWFKAADGTGLDPSVAANADQIAANIKASIRVLDDDDHDGHDDQGEDGSGHH
jgi:hypothetical protein